MKLYGLVGKSLQHSFSKDYFEAKFKQNHLDDYQYENFELASIEAVSDLLNNENLKGFNVTIPYKELILPFLNEIDDEAQRVGAVNTVIVSRENNAISLKGFNTDVFGFRQAIKPFLNSSHERALILGSGGASKAIRFVLDQFNIPYLIVSRTPIAKNEISWDSVNEFVIKYHQLIINTTPLGMFPHIDAKPEIPYQELTSKHMLIDLVYNPLKTEFMVHGIANDAMVINGMSMLQHQAERAWELWKND